MPAHPLELLPGTAGKNLARKLRETRGYVSLLEPSPQGTERQRRRALPAHAARALNRRGGARGGQWESWLPLPRYYLDFEGIDLPVPRCAGVRPYEQVPFQWSCHIEGAAATPNVGSSSTASSWI